MTRTSSSSSSSSSDSDIDYKRKRSKDKKSSKHRKGPNEKSTKNLELTKNTQNYGPSLPTKLQKEAVDSNNVCGPQLPPHLLQKPKPELQAQVCGPALPPHLLKRQEEAKKQNNSVEANNSSVALKTNVIGPSLPDHLRQKLSTAFDAHFKNEPQENSDDECYGPLPPEIQSHSRAHVALEERALEMKLGKFNQQSDKTVREEWMIELPQVHASNLGLGPRQFRSKAGPDLSDRTSWTKTPKTSGKTEKDEKVDLKKEAELKALRERDLEQEEMAKKANKKKKRDKSLYDEHQDKLKKKKEEEPKEDQERRPFNREVDLKVNHFDEAQKKAIMKKAQLLDDRFSQGQSKFL